MSERFSITWMNGAYYVSIPNYHGGEVVRAEAYDTLTSQRDMLVKALEKAVARQGFTNDELIDARALLSQTKEGGA